MDATGVDGLVYIDNIILALDEDAAKVARLIQNCVKKAAHQLGAVIKPDSLMMGSVVEWLGVEIDCEAGIFRLKQSFVRKLSSAAEKIFTQTGEWPIRAWYAISSSIIYAIWTRQQELCTIHCMYEQIGVERNMPSRLGPPCNAT